MKTPKRSLLWAGILISCLSASSQNAVDSIPFQMYEVPVYQAEPFSRQLSLAVPYASSEISRPALWQEVAGANLPYEVDLVFTKYPRDFSRWRTDYDFLLQERVNALIALDTVFASKQIRWNLVLQTGCTTESEAKRFFHGFVIKYRPRNYRVISDIQSPNDLEALMRGDAIPADSTVIKVVERHPDWKDLLVVIDWTGSMYQYGAQLVLWQKAHLSRGQNRTRHLVFFNDGNAKKTNQKVIGKTGGIYLTAADKLDKVVFTMEKVMMKGDGGDARENDLEALLKAIHYLEDYQDIILIADNKSDVRDLSLLHKLDRPVHIILCGIEDDNYINTDYVKIAFHSGGSLHTIAQDLEELQALQPGERIAIGNMEYENRNGNISQVARARE